MRVTKYTTAEDRANFRKFERKLIMGYTNTKDKAIDQMNEQRTPKVSMATRMLNTPTENQLPYTKLPKNKTKALKVIEALGTRIIEELKGELAYERKNVEIYKWQVRQLDEARIKAENKVTELRRLYRGSLNKRSVTEKRKTEGLPRSPKRNLELAAKRYKKAWDKSMKNAGANAYAGF